MPMLWAARAHEFGPGKIHILDDTQTRTECGKSTTACPGAITAGAANCKSCLTRVENRPIAEAARAEWAAKHEAERVRRENENREWWKKYNAYLTSPPWKAKSRAVILRARGVCEGCGVNPATEAHHLNYDHVFAEPLFDLVAVCHPCHEAITEMDRKARE
jgi:hypothetical protein